MKKVLLTLCKVFVLFLALPLWAETVTYSTVQLNNKLAESFPIVKRYQGLKVSFNDAKVRLDVLDKTLKIDTVILAECAGQVLRASALLFGPLDYDQITQQVVMRDPKLEEFYVTDDQMEESNAAIRIIKQTISANLEDIVIIDTTNIDFHHQDLEPVNITISPRGVVISLD